ncbi:hypothetical protein T484DRAFT_1802495 [Baffinella frigidus]|nr:hypothetical protein T484DRAFT_1802495 [Cryptophyta sp. CCMP2293]
MSFSQCSHGAQCLLLGQNPERGVVHFDSIGAAIMTIFQIMTDEGWLVSARVTGHADAEANCPRYAIMSHAMGAYNPGIFVYFVTLMFVGPIFAIQLFLVVISTQIQLFLVVISTQYAITKETLNLLDAQAKALEYPPAIQEKPVEYDAPHSPGGAELYLSSATLLDELPNNRRIASSWLENGPNGPIISVPNSPAGRFGNMPISLKDIPSSRRRSSQISREGGALGGDGEEGAPPREEGGAGRPASGGSRARSAGAAGIAGAEGMFS